MRREWTPEGMRELLRRHNWTQERFARELDITARTLRRCLQTGKISPRVAAACDRLEAEASGRCTHRCLKHCGGEVEGVLRRHLLGALGAFGVLGVPAVGSGEAMGSQLYRAYATQSPGALLVHARIHALLHPSPDAFGFVGFLAQMLEARGDSRDAFSHARDLAFDSGDARARAQALLGLSNAHRGTPAALPMVQEALAIGADPWTLLWGELRLAKEYAYAGPARAGDCRGALWRAERLLGVADPQDENGFYSPTGFFTGWDAAYLASERAECELLLGDGRRALAAIEEVDARGGDLSERGKTLVVIRRGGTHRLLGEIDAAAVALAEGWRRAEATGHELARTKVLEQRALIDPKHRGVAEVRDLDELIRT